MARRSKPGMTFQVWGESMNNTSNVRGRDLGVAPLSAVATPAIEFIRAAHGAGFTSVGLRPYAVTDTDPPFPTEVSSKDFKEIRSALEETGLQVLDIEVLSVTPTLRREDWLPGMEAGAELGASLLNVVGDDTSLTRFTDTVSRITDDARAYNLLPVLEPVAYRPFNSYPLAFDIAADTGCAVELDMLHFLRTGADIQTMASHAELIKIVQLCDAPRRTSDHGHALRRLSTDDSATALAIAESRALRLLPGDGVAPIADLLKVLDPDVPLSVEVPGETVRSDRTVKENLTELHARTTNYLAHLNP